MNHIWRTQLAEVKQNVSEEALRSTTLDIRASDEDTKLLQKSLFYLNNRDTFGNWKKVFPMVMGLILPLFIVLVDILPLVILEINDDDNEYNDIILRAVQLFCYAAIFGVIFHLIRRIGRIADKYAIGKELLGINICFTVFILLERIINMIVSIFGNEDEFDEILVFIASFCSIFSILFSLYFGSFWVLRKLFDGFAGSNTMKDFEGRQTLKTLVTVCMKDELIKNSTEQKEIEENQLSLNKVLASKFGFESFTQFLISELSVENILFLVEVKQYKACCRI